MYSMNPQNGIVEVFQIKVTSLNHGMYRTREAGQVQKIKLFANIAVRVITIFLLVNTVSINVKYVAK